MQIHVKKNWDMILGCHDCNAEWWNWTTQETNTMMPSFQQNYTIAFITLLGLIFIWIISLLMMYVQ